MPKITPHSDLQSTGIAPIAPNATTPSSAERGDTSLHNWLAQQQTPIGTFIHPKEVENASKHNSRLKGRKAEPVKIARGEISLANWLTQQEKPLGVSIIPRMAEKTSTPSSAPEHTKAGFTKNPTGGDASQSNRSEQQDTSFESPMQQAAPMHQSEPSAISWQANEPPLSAISHSLCDPLRQSMDNFLEELATNHIFDLPEDATEQFIDATVAPDVSTAAQRVDEAFAQLMPAYDEAIKSPILLGLSNEWPFFAQHYLTQLETSYEIAPEALNPVVSDATVAMDEHMDNDTFTVNDHIEQVPAEISRFLLGESNDCLSHATDHSTEAEAHGEIVQEVAQTTVMGINAALDEYISNDTFTIKDLKQHVPGVPVSTLLGRAYKRRENLGFPRIKKKKLRGNHQLRFTAAQVEMLDACIDRQINYTELATKLGKSVGGTITRWVNLRKQQRGLLPQVEKENAINGSSLPAQD